MKKFCSIKSNWNKWFNINWKWFVAAVTIPIVGILVTVYYTSSSSNIKNVNVNEMKGGVIGDINNLVLIEAPKSFSDEHIQLIESRRNYINENNENWYNYTDGQAYLNRFNNLVDQLIKAAENEQSILFQEKLKEIHFLSFELESEEEEQKTSGENPGIMFFPDHDLFSDFTKRGIVAGRLMNYLKKGVNTNFSFED